VKGIQVCSNKQPGPLQRGDNKKKVGWGNLKTQGQFLPDLAQIVLGDIGFKFVQRKGIAPLQGEMISKV
jgi:hypothetical protein